MPRPPLLASQLTAQQQLALDACAALCDCPRRRECRCNKSLFTIPRLSERTNLSLAQSRVHTLSLLRKGRVRIQHPGARGIAAIYRRIA